MAMAVDGLVSNLNTTELINSLIQVEAAPQTLLKQTLTSTTTLNSAFKTLNSLVASITTTADSAGKPAALAAFTAKSSGAAATATAGADAVPGSISFRVDGVATAQRSVTAASTTWTAGPVLTISRPGEDPVEIAITGGDHASAAAAINAADAGVTATVVRVGTDVDGTPLLRLQLTGSETGEDAAFQVHAGTAAEVAGGTATDLLAQPGAATISTAQDARIVLWEGTAAEQVVTSATGVFDDLLTGVDVTASAVTTEAVTVTVARDDNAAVTAFTAMTTALQKAFDYIGTQSAVVTTTGTDGAQTTTGGAFAGDGTVRRVRDQLRGAVGDPIDGRSPSEIGISFDRTGALKIDDAAFRTAMAEDPEGTRDMVAKLSSRIEGAATSASDSHTGYLTARVTSGEQTAERLNDRIAEWDLRLASRRTTLERVYSALEVRLADLQSQSSWLTSQLSSLGTSS
jgi:flagellar hook-associated protein 2